MFFCCGKEDKTAKYALQIYNTPGVSEISQDKSIELKGFVPGPRSRVIDHMGKNTRLQPKGKLDNVMNFIKTHNSEFTDFVVKKILKSNYQKIVEEHANTSQKWTDPDFPPEQRSFGLGRQTEKVVWQRIDKIIKQPRFVGGGSIDSQDILQGRIGDCYFLSAISGLAEKDYRIKAIFPNLDMNKNGIYMARILHKGVFQEVVVDDYFPVSKYDHHIMGANPAKGEEIWVMILEKCWAKLFGSYEAIDGGLPKDVLHAFSAAPIYQHLTNVDEKELAKIFNTMMEGVHRDWVICCGTYNSYQVEDMGLVQGHAYTILGVFDRPRKLVKIRNPWGEKEWKGGASDSDKKFWNSISPLDRKRLGHENKDDGVFFMFWEEFINYFQLVDICKIEDKANYYYEEITYPKATPVYTILTSKGGEATVALTQQNTRGIEVPQPRYASTTIIIAKKVGQKGDYRYIDSLSARNHCDVNLEVYLQDGEYVICSMLTGRLQKEDATLSCYCEHAIQMEVCPPLKEEDFLHRIFLDHAKNNKENHQRIFGGVDVWVCMDIVYDSGFAYTAVHIGPSAKVKLGLTFNEDEYEDNNFELIAPNRGRGNFKIVVQSGEDAIVLCRIIPKNFVMEASMPIPGIKRLC